MELGRWLCDVPFSLSIYLSSILKVIVIVRGIHCTHRKSGFHRKFSQVVGKGRGVWVKRRCSRCFRSSSTKLFHLLRGKLIRLPLRSGNRIQPSKPENVHNQPARLCQKGTNLSKKPCEGRRKPPILNRVRTPNQSCPSNLSPEHLKISHKIGRLLQGFAPVLWFSRF